jgi:hypothetical protein
MRTLQSGIPVRKVRIITWPVTSARRIVPFDDTRRFTRSSTSMYTSFFLCTMPSRRLDTQRRGSARQHMTTHDVHKQSHETQGEGPNRLQHINAAMSPTG